MLVVADEKLGQGILCLWEQSIGTDRRSPIQR